MLTTGKRLSAEQRRLIRLHGALDAAGRDQLLAFAEFLVERHGGDRASQPRPVPEPKQLPRPEGESVVAAIKRLSASYFMLDTTTLFNETSALMSAHLLQGRPAAEVIDELESLFEQCYRKLLSESGQFS